MSIEIPENHPAEQQIEIFSRFGIEMHENFGRKILHIPVNLVSRLTHQRHLGRDVVNKVFFPQIFSGSHPAWGQMSETHYLVELPSYATQRQIQDLINLIEQ